MDILIRNNLADVYGQRECVDRAIRDALMDGEGSCTVSVVEPAESLDWHFILVAADGIPRPVTIAWWEQFDWHNLPQTITRKLRLLLVA